MAPFSILMVQTVTSPFRSFWMGGFEGADHINGSHVQLDMVRSSGHLEKLDTHYATLAKNNIKTVRESIGWRTVQPATVSSMNFRRAKMFAECAEKHGIQIIWTFMHYGMPIGVDLRKDEFISQFAWYAKMCALTLRPYDPNPVFNLINEISFLCWVATHTDELYPYHGKQDQIEGYEIKKRLVKAVLAGMREVTDVIPTARFLHVEPLMHFVAPTDRPELEGLAQEVRAHQWQTWEMLRGTLEPKLGGHPEALDLMGVNYYYNGQMEVVTEKVLDWSPRDPRRAPFGELLQEVWSRYQRPLIISETGHFDEQRPDWLEYVLSETQGVIDKVPLLGLCIYPLVDRPCWNDPDKIICCGLLDHENSMATLGKWQKTFNKEV